MSHVTLTLACNNRCVFCAQRGRDGDAPLEGAEPRDATVDDAGRIAFAGGEPTLVPDLLDRVRAARADGAARVLVQTNGRRLAYKAFAQSLADAGVTDIEISLQGPTPAVHDYHTQIDGSYAQTVKGALNARAVGLSLTLSSVVTRSNFRHLPALAQLVAKIGANAWHIGAAAPVGAAGLERDRVVPRLAMIAPLVAEAAVIADRAGVATFATGVPLCLVGGAPLWQLTPGSGDYGPACDSCAARGSCGGVTPGSDARSVSDMRTLSAAPRAGARPASWFAGIGLTAT